MGKRGPKPRGEFEGKTETFTTRITPKMREALETEARRHGRSISQEVERRLHDSFDNSDMSRPERDAPTYALLRLFTQARWSIEFGTGKHWLDLLADRSAMPAGPSPSNQARGTRNSRPT